MTPAEPAFPARRVLTWVPVVLGAAIAARLIIYFAINVRDPGLIMQPDSHAYLNLAANLVNEGVFSSAAGAPFPPDHFRTPGYPLLLAFLHLLGAGPRVVVLFQIRLGSLVCLAASWGAWKLSRHNGTAAILTGLLCAFDVPSAFAANHILSETLFTALILVPVLLVLLGHFRLAFAGGLLLGFAALTRPNALFLPFLLSLFILYQGRGTRSRSYAAAAVLLLGSLLVVTPWFVRNARLFGGPFLSTVGYDYLLYVQGGGVVSVTEDIPYWDVKAALMEELPSRDVESSAVYDLQKAKLERALAIITAHPFVYARNVLVGSCYTLLAPLRHDVDLVFAAEAPVFSLQEWGGANSLAKLAAFAGSASPATLLHLLMQLAHVAVLYGGITWALLRRRVDGPAALLLLGLIGYFCLLSGGPESYGRFRVPLIPFLAVLAGVGLAPPAAMIPAEDDGHA